MGSGLVYMLVPNEIRSMCLTAVPEALTYDISDKALISANAVLVGPGAANEDRMREIIKMQINGAEKLVLDAGALSIIADNRDMFRELLSTRRIDGKMLPIFTPHTGELDRLMPEHKLLDRTAKAQRASEYFNCILIHKGAGTVIASPEGDIWINTSGNSSMAKGGSGDILSGIIASLLGQGLTPEDAAVLGTYFHGLCGDLSANEFGEISAIPTDMLTEIRKAYDLIRTENR
jgi:NAD(P)H-hydrate epimerase